MPPTDAEIRRALGTARTIAIVGLSEKPERDSHRVGRYLQAQGYRIVPVNPNLTEVLGERAYPDLAAVPPGIRIDLVDIFRRSEEVPPVVDATIHRGGVATVWMQLGVRNAAAAQAGRDAGLVVFEDLCTMAQHRRLKLPPLARER